MDAVTNDNYSKQGADFSVTELIKPPRQRALEKKHALEIVEDVSDRLWSLYGQVAHTILERANKAALVEKRFFMTINGRTISGQIDSLEIEDGILRDWKFTSAWAFVGKKPPKPEHVQQLNMQKLLLESQPVSEGLEHPYKVNRLQIGALLRDWQLSKSKLDKKYPPPIVLQELPVWEREETVRFVQGRIYLHEQAAIELPECSSADTWSGRRCSDYCDVNKFCDQFKNKEQLDAF